ncbi:MAG: symmetrical bis(5'-nucleosyl)-tetraphosphatase [Gammaproteobacteria bacterium]|nr:symmetrical bis(5'-nucleosyl)-tetraphosphatase [Gammaproteobacteria bacterium]
MSTWAIGDVQGALPELQALLGQIGFSDDDRLWFVGDLVNRGPQSAEVLRFVRGLGDRAVVVLGNHDLHLLAIASGARKAKQSDNCADVLREEDGPELIDWLRNLPLLHHDEALGCTLVHAGMSPFWDLKTAVACAREVEQVLRSDDYARLLTDMYGDGPDLWAADLAGEERLRYIINAFTRMRMCDAEGRLRLTEKGAPFGREDGLVPWFSVPGRVAVDSRIVFGHWSTLGRYSGTGIEAIDTGCIWGGSLTALELDEEGRCVQQPCAGYCRVGSQSLTIT